MAFGRGCGRRAAPYRGVADITAAPDPVTQLQDDCSAALKTAALGEAAKARQRAGGGDQKSAKAKQRKSDAPTSEQAIQDRAGRVDRQLAAELKVRHGTVAPSRWLRPIAHYDRKETSLVEGSRYG